MYCSTFISLHPVVPSVFLSPFLMAVSLKTIVVCMRVLVCIMLGQLKTIQSSDVESVPKYRINDLVLVNGLYGDDSQRSVAICLEQHDEFTEVGFFNLINESASEFVSYNYHCVPTKAVRAFSIRNTKRSIEDNQAHTDNIFGSYLGLINDERFKESQKNSSVPHQVYAQLLFGVMAYHFGIAELFFLYNSYKEPHGFDDFYQKYMRLEPRSLTQSAIAHGVKAGDLVKIKSLKPQKNASLHIRAQHFSGSFGEISTFTSGDLERKNSRNQPEFAIQSLFDKSEKLALRPKYLSKVTKVYVHRITTEVVFSDFAKLRSIWKNQLNEVLFLPFAKDESGLVHFSKRN